MDRHETGTYYVLSAPDQVVRYHEGRSTRLAPDVVTTWSGPGANRRAAAAAVLADARREPPSAAEVDGFARDVLDYYGTSSELVLSLEEVNAWYRDRGPELAAAAPPAFASLPEALAHRDRQLRGGPRPGWLAMYRTIHGPPEFPDAHRGLGGSEAS